jgi:hypothetical protein
MNSPMHSQAFTAVGYPFVVLGEVRRDEGGVVTPSISIALLSRALRSKSYFQMGNKYTSNCLAMQK